LSGIVTANGTKSLRSTNLADSCERCHIHIISSVANGAFKQITVGAHARDVRVGSSASGLISTGDTASSGEVLTVGAGGAQTSYITHAGVTINASVLVTVGSNTSDRSVVLAKLA
jgi:hypothetical protein